MCFWDTFNLLIHRPTGAVHLQQMAERVTIFIINKRNKHLKLMIPNHNKYAAPHVKKHVQQAIHCAFFANSLEEWQVTSVF